MNFSNSASNLKLVFCSFVTLQNTEALRLTSWSLTTLRTRFRTETAPLLHHSRYCSPTEIQLPNYSSASTRTADQPRGQWLNPCICICQAIERLSTQAKRMVLRHTCSYHLHTLQRCISHIWYVWGLILHVKKKGIQCQPWAQLTSHRVHNWCFMLHMPVCPNFFSCEK